MHAVTGVNFVTKIRKILHFSVKMYPCPPNIGYFVSRKWLLKTFGTPFPTSPLIEVHLYGNERQWTKIGPHIEVPHF